MRKEGIEGEGKIKDLEVGRVLRCLGGVILASKIWTGLEIRSREDPIPRGWL